VSQPAVAFRRARSSEHKARRVRDLVDAARTLASERGARTVTLTAIATRAGVHVSGVRRYFDSREDILLALASEGWQEWATRAGRALQPGLGGHPVRVADALAETLAELPLFCDLLAQVALSLEREAPLESVRAAAVTELEQVGTIADAVAAASAGLDRNRARELVVATALLAGALWQTGHPSDEVAGLHRDDPRLASAVVEFPAQLARLVRALTAGLALEDSRSDGGGAGGV
jgi:AcrR family transcriptional regulator